MTSTRATALTPIDPAPLVTPLPVFSGSEMMHALRVYRELQQSVDQETDERQDQQDEVNGDHEGLHVNCVPQHTHTY